MSREKFSILLADNRQIAPQDIQAILSKNSEIDFRLDVSHSGKEAILKVSENDYDLVLLNEDLPDKRGISMLQELLKKKLGIPVILIVAEGKEKIGVKAMDKGAYDFLTVEEVKTPALERAIRRVMHRKRLENEIMESLRKMETLAIRDGLTGLFNYRHFREVLRNEFKKARRHFQDLSCIMIDLDFFKQVNDTHGHQFGDYVLSRSAEIITGVVRDTDFVARYGGEEFFIILPNTDMDGAIILAERIRTAFANNVFRKGAVSQVVTVSLGISSISDENVISDEDLIENADRALYMAKDKGRNMVCTFEDVLKTQEAGLREERKKVRDFHKRLFDLNEDIKQNCIEATHAILKDIEKEWDYINTHSTRVSRLAEDIARGLGLRDEETNVVKRAALLHDIGMIGINSRILRKRTKLTKKEYETIKRHTILGVKLIERTRLFDKELPIILHHHERYDGTGYPNNLRGERIPMGSRIISVAEAFDAMTASNSYKKAIATDDAIVEIKNCSGTQFDPLVVNAFIKVISSSKKGTSRKSSSKRVQ